MARPWGSYRRSGHRRGLRTVLGSGFAGGTAKLSDGRRPVVSGKPVCTPDSSARRLQRHQDGVGGFSAFRGRRISGASAHRGSAQAGVPVITSDNLRAVLIAGAARRGVQRPTQSTARISDLDGRLNGCDLCPDDADADHSISTGRGGRRGARPARSDRSRRGRGLWGLGQLPDGRESLPGGFSTETVPGMRAMRTTTRTVSWTEVETGIGHRPPRSGLRR